MDAKSSEGGGQHDFVLEFGHRGERGSKDLAAELRDMRTSWSVSLRLLAPGKAVLPTA